MSSKLRLVLVDDHAVVLEALCCLLGSLEQFEIVAAFTEGEKLLPFLESNTVDVVLLDWQMPYHGLRVLREVRAKQPGVRVLILTGYGDRDTIHSVWKLQAEGIILKTEPLAQLVEAIQQVAQGYVVFPKAAQPLLARTPRTAEGLSGREMEVLGYVARGLTNSEIARELQVSQNTVSFHLKNIFEKLQISNRTEATIWYFANASSFS